MPNGRARVAQTAPTTPYTKPIVTIVAPCRSTRLSTAPSYAPSVMRTPISFVRWPTTRESTP